MGEKITKIREYLKEHSFTGMILARQDNFNWITDGGNSRVIVPRDTGHAAIVVTQEQIYLIAQVMDGQRIMDEEMNALEAEAVFLHWFEASVLDKAYELAGPKSVSDVQVQDAEVALNDIYSLHYPMTDEEYQRMKRLGAISDGIFYKVAKEIRLGMIDYEVEAMLLYEFAKENIQCDVSLIGTDDRIFKYRHPNPSGRKLGRYVLLHTASRQGGLHCNVTRSVYFGDKIPEEIAKAYEICCKIEAFCMSQCKTGNKWSDILKGQKRCYTEAGMPEEWKCHYPGGRTGYCVSQSDLSLDTHNEIQNREAYDGYITATGAKVEELSVNWDGRFEVLSHTGIWPSKKYIAEEVFDLPQIMQL